MERVSSVGQLSELAVPWYSDQILPFDITLAAANEYGAMAGAKILGVEVLTEASGVSIDDTVTETQAHFVARALELKRLRPARLLPACHDLNSLPDKPILYPVTHLNTSN